MSDYIERDAVLRHYKDVDKSLVDSLSHAILKALTVHVEDLPAADVAPIQRWIKCEDRLPEMQENVLLRFEYNTAVGFLREIDEHLAFWCAYIDDGFYEDCDDEPLYWMPLPDAPKDMEDEA